MILKHTRIAVILMAGFTLLTGFAYPVVITGLAHLMFPARAEGSIVTVHGMPTGSSLIGQHFSSPGYFWSRPSATGPFPYNAAASSGSNLAPSNPALRDRVAQDVHRLMDADTTLHDHIPVDLVTASASGLDPDISPAAALIQVPRVASARGMTERDVRALVDSHTEGRFLGSLGEPRVNVLLLNLALDARDHQDRRH